MFISRLDFMVTDQGSVFMSTYFTERCDRADIHLRHTVTESHNSFDGNERLHSVLRKTFFKITLRRPTNLCSRPASMNSTAGADNIVPALLVFGVLSRLPGVHHVLPAQNACFEAMRAARKEYARPIAQIRVQKGLY